MDDGNDDGYSARLVRLAIGDIPFADLVSGLPNEALAQTDQAVAMWRAALRSVSEGERQASRIAAAMRQAMLQAV